MKRLLLAFAAAVTPVGASAQTYPAERVMVAGVPLPTALSAKGDAITINAALATKADAAATASALAGKADAAPTISALAAKADATATTSALALKAPTLSPVLTGTPTAPTPATTDSSTTVATTAFAEPRRPRSYIVRLADGVVGASGLNTQIVAANAAAASVVVLPAGTLTLDAVNATAAITGNHLTIAGQGSATNISVPCGHNGRVFTVNGAVNLIIRDVRITYATGCAAGQTPTTQAFSVNGMNDGLIENINISGGYGLLIGGQTTKNARLTVVNVAGGAWQQELGGKAIELYRGTSNTFERVRYTGNATNAGTASTRAVYIAPAELMDTVRLNEVTIWAPGGIPTLVTFDFSNFDLANVFITRSVFDSSTTQAMEVISTGTTFANMTLFEVAQTRFATDGGSGIRFTFANPNAYIKTIDLNGNYIVSKSSGGSQLNFDATSTGLIRNAKVRANTFGDAVQSGTQPAAVLLGMNNVLLLGNFLSNVDELTVAGTARTSYFAKATRANVKNLLIGNVSNALSGFLDESAFTLGAGRTVVANYP